MPRTGAGLLEELCSCSRRRQWLALSSMWPRYLSKQLTRVIYFTSWLSMFQLTVLRVWCRSSHHSRQEAEQGSNRKERRQDGDSTCHSEWHTSNQAPSSTFCHVLAVCSNSDPFGWNKWITPVIRSGPSSPECLQGHSHKVYLAFLKLVSRFIRSTLLNFFFSVVSTAETQKLFFQEGFWSQVVDQW